MVAYWIAYLFPAALTLVRLRISRGFWVGIIAVFTLFIGLRYQVGGDWGAYIQHLQRVSALPFNAVFLGQDPGYYLVNWLAAQSGLGVGFVNIVCGAVFMTGLVYFVRQLPRPLLAFSVAVPYLVTVVAMGYTRQAVALGIVMLGLSLLSERRLLGFLLAVAIASAFHKSAVVLVPIAVLANREKRLPTLLWAGISGVVLYLVFLAEQVERLWQNYILADYSAASEGGPIRVAMNALPAIVFLLWRKRFALTDQQRSLWFWIAVFSLACMVLVFQAPTAIDRVALYFLPIQMFVWSHFPSLFKPSQRIFIVLGIIAGYALVLFVWLNFASHRSAWLPYQFWPLVQ